MSEFISVLNDFLNKNILVNIFVFAFISELFIYFGIRQNDKKDRLFHIFIFASFQLILINYIQYFSLHIEYAGLASILSAIIVLFLLNIGFFRTIIYKTRSTILINGWDSLGKKAIINSPSLVRVKLKNGEILHGIYANESNISFSENLNGIFLEKSASFGDDGNLEIDEFNNGIWINSLDIITIELLNLKQKTG